MKHILLVEDDPRISSALAIRLRFAGYDVAVARDPKCGVSLAVDQPPDLVITDLYLPQMDGLSFVSELRNQGLGGVPFMVITAGRKAGLRESAARLGAVECFEKPYDPARLMATIGAVLNHRPNPEASVLKP